MRRDRMRKQRLMRRLHFAPMVSFARQLCSDRSAACAIAVYNEQGAMVACLALALQGHHSRAWGIFFAVTLCPCALRIVTDCLSLFKTAECGTASATAAKQTLGGVSTRIGATLDGNLASLVEQKRLVWMLAHQSAAATARRSSPMGSRSRQSIGELIDLLTDVVARSAATRRAFRGLSCAALTTQPMRSGWRPRRLVLSPERRTTTTLT